MRERTTDLSKKCYQLTFRAKKVAKQKAFERESAIKENPEMESTIKTMSCKKSVIYSYNTSPLAE